MSNDTDVHVHHSAGLSRPHGPAPGVVLTGASVGVGLMAGLFFAFDVGVLPGLRTSDDLTFVTVVQNVNRAIENGLFGLVFIGAFLATGAAALMQQRIGNRRAARWVWAALVCYSAMLTITMSVNIPLNNALAQAGAPEKIPDLRAVREAFEGPWSVANIARTLTCTAALGFLGRALALHSRARARRKGV
ncbi:anthrone oxygenase family protein [Nocardiopsis salina]|uniref:anthrone oxygenase family protein n=1 Tax=Nocardiopsis salina TaxID=245836 RepID=UPI00034CF1D3|nr:DUF1772 domain-containing protein [Nocardiopsis salina]